MPRLQIVIDYDLETGKVTCGHPKDKVACAYMFDEARRILDRVDDKRAAAEAKSRIVPPGEEGAALVAQHQPGLHE